MNNLIDLLIDFNLNNIQFKFKNELIPLTIAIFLTGFIGYIESQEFLGILINSEIMMLGINFNIITNSILSQDYEGQVLAISLLAITAAETAVGLGILILMYRTKGNIAFEEFSTLKG